MPYNEVLAERVRSSLGNRGDVTERKMFGGIAFMVRGNMCCGIVKDDLMLRVGPERHDEALEAGARLMDFTGRPMKGMVFVDAGKCKTENALANWIRRGLDFVDTLPAK